MWSVFQPNLFRQPLAHAPLEAALGGSPGTDTVHLPDVCVSTGRAALTIHQPPSPHKSLFDLPMNGEQGITMSIENMPVMRGVKIKSIPMDLLKPFEPQAVRNHSQSLQRLAERGGMCPTEILGIIRGLRWIELKVRPDDEAELIKWVESQSKPKDTRVVESASASPAPTRSEPAADPLNPLNPLSPISPLNPLNQVDSSEPPRPQSHCEPSSHSVPASSHYSGSGCSSSSSSDYSSSSSSSSDYSSSSSSDSGSSYSSD